MVALPFDYIQLPLCGTPQKPHQHHTSFFALQRNLAGAFIHRRTKGVAFLPGNCAASLRSAPGHCGIHVSSSVCCWRMVCFHWQPDTPASTGLRSPCASLRGRTRQRSTYH